VKTAGAALRLALLMVLVITRCEVNEARADQLPDVLRSQAERQLLNQGRVGLVSGLPGGGYAQVATELSNLVETAGTSPLRVTVQIGLGSVRNLDDLLNLSNVDLAMVQSDVLEAYANVGQKATYDELRQVKRPTPVVAAQRATQAHLAGNTGVGARQ
jgi:TRAP-type uncharacterized transport system substrate-binding protein